MLSINDVGEIFKKAFEDIKYLKELFYVICFFSPATIIYVNEFSINLDNLSVTTFIWIIIASIIIFSLIFILTIYRYIDIDNYHELKPIKKKAEMKNDRMYFEFVFRCMGILALIIYCSTIKYLIGIFNVLTNIIFTNKIILLVFLYLLIRTVIVLYFWSRNK